jgi:hypothetical protein
MGLLCRHFDGSLAESRAFVFERSPFNTVGGRSRSYLVVTSFVELYWTMQKGIFSESTSVLDEIV